LLAFTLLLVLQVTALWAQNNPPNAMLHEIHTENDAGAHVDASGGSGNGSNPGSNATIAYIAIPPPNSPDAPTPQQEKAEAKAEVADKKFFAVMAALAGAETLWFTAQLVLEREFSAGAPWVTSVPSTQQLFTKYAAIYATEVFVAYELKKPHSWLPGDKVIRKFWMAYPMTMIPLDIKNGVRSIRTQPPSCPVDQCQAP
jgi:hypothetical protein